MTAFVVTIFRCRCSATRYWNRIQLEVDNLASLVERLQSDGAHFRNDIVHGNGGTQILLDDPSGNPIELFEPYRG